MRIADIQSLYGYTWWANARILATAAPLSPEQFATAALGHINLRATLVHMIEAQEIWLSRWQGRSGQALEISSDSATLASIRAAWHQQEAQIAAYLATLSDADLDRTISFVNRNGTTGTFILWQMMVQVINHGTQHRSELAELLTQLGHSPGNLDYIVFINTQRQAAANPERERA